MDNTEQDALEGTVTFPQKLIAAAVKDKLKDMNNTKMNLTATKLLAEVCRLVVVEAAGRAALEAKMEGEAEVQLHHLEKTLAQLLLDL